MKRLIVNLVILSIIGVLFFPYFKNKNTPLPIDIPVGMYYPWLNESYGYAVRPPVKNSLISDTISQFWIWRNRGVTDLLKGKINIWNPYSFSGYEMSPWFHTMLFSPLNIFYTFLPQIDAMSFIVISQVFLSLLGGYLLGSFVFASPISGWLLAIGWSMSSFFTGWLTWGTISFALAMLPWVLYFFEKHFTFLCTLSLVFLILSGHPQTIGYCLIIFYLWTSIRMLSRVENRLLSFIKPLCIIIISLLLTAPAIFPSLSIISHSIRSLETLVGVNFGFIPWSKLLATLFSVNVFGNPSTGNYFGGDYNFQEKLVNFGTIPLFFTIYQIVKIFRSRKIDSLGVIGLVLLLLGIFLTTRYPFGFLVYRYHLPFLSTSPAGRGIVLAIFGGVILASSGIKDFLSRKVDGKSLWFANTVYFSFFLLLYTILFGSLYFIAQDGPGMSSYYQTIKANFTTAARNSVYPFGIFIILFGLLATGLRFRKLYTLAVYAILLLAFVEGFLFFKKVTPFVPKNLYFPETSSITFVKENYAKTPNLFRFERESGELLPPNMWEVFGFYSTSGYDPIAPLQYEKYMKNKDVHGSISRYFENGAALDKLDEFGVKYFMALKRSEVSIPDKDGKIADSINQKIWKPVFTEGTVVILENQNYTPPYFFSETNPKNSILLTNKADDFWEFTVNTTTDNRFVLMENYSDHWQANIDDTPVTIQKFKETFKEVSVPKGEHKITFGYNNPDFKKGVYLSLVTLAVFFLYLVFRIKY